MENANINEARDPQLLHIARKRASFKYHLISYTIVNGFFWGLWIFTSPGNLENNFPWPLYPMLGWGVGLCFHLAGAYIHPRTTLVDKEYQKLIKQKEIKTINS